MNFEIVIGIEIHCELKTKTKMFSTAPNAFGNTPNTQVSAVDMAFPGILPVLNKRAVELAIIACSALHCEVDNELWFDRKNYFYPDLPKGFQITQDKRPIGRQGYVEIEVNGEKKKIRIERLHMEEDTAKQTHYSDFTLIDYNRCGVPLIEIVSCADMHSGEEAAKYVDKLRSILSYCEVSDCKMEEGSMRCDINISLRPFGQKEFGVKTEIKNLNSINNIQRAIDFEVQRQEKILLSGGKVEQETRRFDEATRQTVLMRKKTDAVDYKYFTEANIMPIMLEDEFISKWKKSVPELFDERVDRYINKYNLSKKDAELVATNKDVSDYVDECLTHFNDCKAIVNYVMGDIQSHLNKTGKTIKQFSVAPELLTKLLSMIKDGKISSKQAKEVFEEMIITKKDPEDIAKKLGMVQLSDSSQILTLINEVLDANPQAIETFKQGRDNILGFLVGQVMKKSQGKANPAMTMTLLKEEIVKR